VQRRSAVGKHGAQQHDLVFGVRSRLHRAEAREQPLAPDV
jgi:hypothetical protein